MLRVGDGLVCVGMCSGFGFLARLVLRLVEDIRRRIYSPINSIPFTLILLRYPFALQPFLHRLVAIHSVLEAVSPTNRHLLPGLERSTSYGRLQRLAWWHRDEVITSLVLRDSSFRPINAIVATDCVGILQRSDSSLRSGDLTRHFILARVAPRLHHLPLPTITS